MVEGLPGSESLESGSFTRNNGPRGVEGTSLHAPALQVGVESNGQGSARRFLVEPGRGSTAQFRATGQSGTGMSPAELPTLDATVELSIGIADVGRQQHLQMVTVDRIR